MQYTTDPVVILKYHRTRITYSWRDCFKLKEQKELHREKENHLLYKLHYTHTHYFQICLTSLDIKLCHTFEKYIKTAVFCIQVFLFQRIFFFLLLTSWKVKVYFIWICCSYLSWKASSSLAQEYLDPMPVKINLTLNKTLFWGGGSHFYYFLYKKKKKIDDRSFLQGSLECLVLVTMLS